MVETEVVNSGDTVPLQVKFLVAAVAADNEIISLLYAAGAKPAFNRKYKI